jgi:acetolactate synthase I/II/III large subunit
MRHGGDIVVEALKAQGVSRVFSVPGESFLAVLDGLIASGIDNIVCRHEGAAAMMAEASGKLTGRPGVAIVTRGPGATNASAGVHVAMQDSTPMVLLIGQIARSDRDREAFQEVNFRAMFAPLAKWAAEVDDVNRLPEYLNRAFHLAMSGRPGPVVLSLPEDVLNATSEVRASVPTALPTYGPAQIDAIADHLRQMKRPLVIAGGSLWSAQAADDLARFARAQGLPVAVSFRRQDYLDNRHDAYAGDLAVGMNPRLAQRLREADGLILLGTRMGDIPTAGFELMTPPESHKRIVHIHPDPGTPGSLWRTDLAVVAKPSDVLAQLARLPKLGDWSKWTKAARQDYLAWTTPRETPGAVKLEAVIRWLSDHLPEDAIVTNGAGNYAAFLHRYFRFKRYGTQLAPTSGSMGYGFPAAIAAKIAHPGRTVVCLAGDGCFQMTLNEISTAVQYGANVITVVCNNGQYGTIRAHQERHFPGRVSGTALANPDFAALARAYGGHGETVERTADFAGAFARAQASKLPAVIELRLDPEALTTGKTLSEVRNGS